MQFEKLPDSVQKLELSASGIRLFDYLPDRAYLAELRDSASIASLSRFSVSSVVRMPPVYKIAERLRQHAEDLNDPDRLIAVCYFGSMTESEVKEDLVNAGAVIVPQKIQPPRVIFVRAANQAVLDKLSNLPFVSYLASQPTKMRALNYNNRAAHGASFLGATSGKNLQGDGVTIGVGDDSSPWTHIDLTGRVIDRSSSSVNLHGTHVSGSVAGGGILNERNKGMAPNATLVNQYFSDILNNAPVYLSDYKMQLTNNSYTNYDYGCQYDGDYDTYSYYTDAQLYSYPALMHVFASGNDGGYQCSTYPVQYATVKSGFQSSKNAIDVGNIDNTNTGYPLLNGGSSSGPCRDGRIKPEVMAGGTAIISTTPYNGYAQDWGTSMSSPTVAGIMALMVQRFRQLYGGGNPYGMMLKALVCNTANDMGTPGPDYLFGFGSINGRAAVDCMEKGQVALSGSGINNGQTANLTLTVPAGLQQVRILLYWPDYPAAPFSSAALVNNLDLTVKDASGTTHYPLILNPDPAHVGDAAVEGVDNLNNIEQVVINVPAGGTFNVSIKGTNVPAGPQPFVVTWQYINPGVILESPYGNETMLSDELEIIRWNAYGGDPNTFKAEYSGDNGTTWNLIQDNIPSDKRMVNWFTPIGFHSAQTRVRVTRNNTSYADSSKYPFTVILAPTVSPSNPCPGYVQLDWNAITGADSFDIMQLKGSSMQKVGSTTGTSFLLGGLNPDSTYWLAVRSVTGGSPGRRSIAVSVTPSGGACTLSAMDNDYTVDSTVGLQSGRLNTSSQLTNAVPVHIQLKNLGSVPTGSSFNLSYSINGGTPVTEPCNAVLAAHGVLDYTFTQTANLSAAGIYNFKIWVTYPGDPLATNDTITTVIRQLTNDPITLNNTFTEGFESATSNTYTTPTMGFLGLDRCDFSANNNNGRARTFVNTGFARTGTRCVTLDQTHAATITTADSLITTFNLSSYSTGDQLWLDFYYKNHGNDTVRTANKVWIRGSDQDAWIQATTLDTTQAKVGVYQPSPHIDITTLLKGATPAQNVSSSFQVKFGQEGYTSATNVVVDPNSPDEGYSFDDITLTRSQNDVGIAALIAPSPNTDCSLSASQTISFKVKNYGNSTATSIPVSYSINGSVVTETIPSINAKDSVTYSFTTPADLSGYGLYTITGWVSMTGDSYRSNDTLAPVTLHTSPLISSFPYLEGFESSNGYWYAEGVNSSWAWGTPAKTIINKAANGTKCWVTSLNGNYNDQEQSYLYSPCFDLSGLNQPVLSFSHIFRMEDNCDCDYHWVEYSTDGITWTKLGSTGSGENWYDNSTRQAWQLSNTKWHVSSYDIPVKVAGVKFRIAMKSDMAANYEGVAIDDVHVFDKASVYSGGNITSGLSHPVSGSGWVNFDMGGKRVAAINPNGQDLGTTNVKVYINTGAVRNDGVQYYLDRNIVIQPAVAPVGPVRVRYYFLASEAINLMNASGCATCTTIADPYQSGVTQYSSPVTAEEDGDLGNDASGAFLYHLPHQDVSIVPYDNGYYAEYSVNGFSEFWINNGGASGTIPLPLTLLSFTATRTGDNGLLQWSTTNDKGTRRFVIQRSNDGVSFADLDSVAASLDSNTTHFYHYTDTRLLPGTTFYRLRMIDQDGTFTYSPVRTIGGSGNAQISIYPNPVLDGNLYVSSPVNVRYLRLTDASGKVLLEKAVQGYQQTLAVGSISRGIYLLVVDTDTGRTVQKVFVK